MNENQNIPEVGSPIGRNAVSIYGQSDPMDDFPVLKAFQQYVDAEHAKAQKRMTTLCIFFVVLMVALIGVFVMLLMNISQRNNALSDQLFQVMLNDRSSQGPVVVQSPAAPQSASNDAALKAMADMQSRLMEQQIKFTEEMIKASSSQAAAAAAKVPDSPVSQSERSEFSAQKKEFAAKQREHEKQVKDETDKLKKAREQLKAEQKKIAEEKARIKEREIAVQRRINYPELYAPKASEAKATVKNIPPPPRLDKTTLADDDDLDAEALSNIDVELEREMKRLEEEQRNRQYKDIEAVTYFDEDDEDDLVRDLESRGKAAASPKSPARSAQRPAQKPAAGNKKTNDWSMPL